MYSCDNAEDDCTFVTMQRLNVQLLQCRGCMYSCDKSEVGCTFVTMQRLAVHLLQCRG